MSRSESVINRYGDAEKVTTSGTSAQSGACPAQHYRARLAARTSPMWIKVGDNPTATTDGTSTWFAATHVEYVQVAPGQKVAAIQDGAAGELNITWLTN